MIAFKRHFFSAALGVFLLSCAIYADDEFDEFDDDYSQYTQSNSINETLSILSLQNKDNSIDLAQLLEGAKTNYNLETKDIAILQAKAAATAAKMEFLPTLDGSYEYQSVDNTYRTQASQSANLRASWEVFSGFKTTNKNLQQNALHGASVYDRANTQEQLFMSVIEQYYSYFSNQAQKISLEQKQKQLQVNIERVEKLYRSGLTTIDDVESLRAEILRTDYDISNIILAMEQNKLMLSLLTNLEVQELSRTEIANPTLKLENRNDILALEKQAQAAKYQARQITYLPSVTISDTYGWSELDTNSYKIKNAYLDLFGGAGGGIGGSLGSPNFAKSNYPNYQNVIGVSVSMRIFDFGNIAKQREAMRYVAMQREKELAYKKNEQKKDEKLYRKSLEIAEAKIKSAEAALKSASVSFDNVAKKYNAQILNFTDYLQSLSRKFDAEALYSQSLNDYEIQKVRYIYFSGQKIEDYIK